MFGSKNLTVGVIGLGIIGSRVAERLRKAGHNVFVWNRTSRPEPNFLSSPHEVAEIANFIQIFVRDSEALVQVMKEMQPALKKSHVICAHSTVRPLAMRQAFAIADEKGAGFLDAPFTGSKLAAEKGELVYYLSGDERDQEKAKPLLTPSSKAILNFGKKVGDATVLKIATNLVSANIVQALGEAFALTESQGIDGAQLLNAFQNNANCSPLISMKLPAMISGDYEPHFSLKNMLKDAHYAQELANEKKVQTPALGAAVAAMELAEKAGKGERDYSVVYENFPPRTPAGSNGAGSDVLPAVGLKKQTRIMLKPASVSADVEDDEEGASTRRPLREGEVPT